MRRFTTQRRINKLILFFALLVANTLIQAENRSPITRGYPDSDTFWGQSADGTTSIPVCWINPGDVPAERLEWVEEALEATWEKESLVKFTQWITCPHPHSDFAGVRIRIEDARSQTIGLGTEIMKGDREMTLNLLAIEHKSICSADFTLKECAKMVAIHEFGHVLGFAHEQNRPENIPTDLNCKKGDGSEGNVTVGPWDLSSIMNYCNTDSFNHGNLSPIDKYMVKAAYGNVPIYYPSSQLACFPVVAYAGKNYSACLKQAGGKWQVVKNVETSKNSIDPALLEDGKLSIPFVFNFDNEKVPNFYKDLIFQQDAEGLFTLTSPATPL